MKYIDKSKYPKNTCIQCKTPELAEKVGELINNNNHMAWNSYVNEFCMELNENLYCGVNWFRENGYNIIQAEDFLKDHNQNNIEYSIF